MSYSDRYGDETMMHGHRVVRCATPSTAKAALADDDGWSDHVDDEMYRVATDVGPIAWLPHQCNQWVIGGPDEVRQMIADLQAALVEMEKP